LSDFLSTTASNSPKVQSAAAVEALLARYYVNPDLSAGVNYDHDTGEPYLFLFGHTWPEVWKLPEDESAEEFDPHVEGIFEEGAGGFIEFLEELALHLKEPLTVHAIGSTRCFFPLSACEWHIAEGGSTVELTEFRHGQLEHSAK
jgi:hypothetical protein